MPKLKKSTKKELKKKLLELVNGIPKPTVYFRQEINRSWGYTFSLLRELEKSKKIKMTQIGRVLAWMERI